MLAVICVIFSFYTYREYSPIDDAEISGEIINISGNRLTLNNSVVTKDGISTACGKCYIYSNGTYAVGDVITLTADLSPVARSAQNPGDKNTHLSCCAKHLSYSGYGNNILLTDHRNDIYTFFDSVRRTMYSRLALTVEDKDTLSSLYGMLTGDKSHIDDTLSESYSAAGVSHLLAVSGFHIALLLGILTYILDKIKIRRIGKIIPVLAFLIFYLFLTGFPPSVIRASIMALAVIFSSSFGLRYDPLNMLSFAGTCILLLSPFELFDVSFQLSFCACFGIIAFYKHFDGIFGKILNSVIITVSATVATLPIILYQFGSISSVSVIANLIVVPISSLALILLVIAIVPIMISPYFLPLALPSYYVGFAANKIIELMSKIPPINMPVDSGLIALGLLLYVIFISKYCHVKNRIKILVSVLLIASISTLSVISIVNRSACAEIRVLYSDNNSLCVHISQNNDYLIGYDDSYAEKRYVSRNLPSIDGAFILCADDIKGLNNLENKSRFIKNVYSGIENDPEVFTEAFNVISAEQFMTDESDFYLTRQGLTYSYLGKTVFIGSNDQTCPCENDVDINISRNFPVENAVNITNTFDSRFDFSSQDEGCITIIIKKDGIRIFPFNEVDE